MEKRGRLYHDFSRLTKHGAMQYTTIRQQRGNSIASFATTSGRAMNSMTCCSGSMRPSFLVSVSLISWGAYWHTNVADVRPLKAKPGASTCASGGEASAGRKVLSAGSTEGSTIAGNPLRARETRASTHVQAVSRTTTHIQAALAVPRCSPRFLTLTSAQMSAAVFLLILTLPQWFATTASTLMFAIASNSL